MQTEEVILVEKGDRTGLNETGAARFANETATISKQEYIELKAAAARYKELHARSLKREEELKREIEQLKATVRDLQQKLYGKQSEKTRTKNEKQPDLDKKKPRARGHRVGCPGHGRKPSPSLPVEEHIVDVADDQKRCPKCTKPYSDMGITRDSDTLEIEVKGYIRRVKRKCYVATCECEERAEIVAAPVEPRLIPKGKVGISVWVELLLSKYHYGEPLNRQLSALGDLGFDLSSGTVIGGFKKLVPLFEPLMVALKERQKSDSYFNADETTWRVFETIEGKIGNRWYLWLFRSESALFYVLDPSRAAHVPISHMIDMLKKVIVVCDRYSAYKKMARTLGILLAYCWAHVRRDFLELARGYPALEPWSTQWVARIGTLYHLNDLRLKSEENSPQRAECHTQLTEHLAQMKHARDHDLANPQLHAEARQRLESMENHWQGLTVFVEHPDIPMDNNAAERGMRMPVNGRKNYNGSGARWAGEFAAMMFSIFMTLVLCWQINPRRWLNDYLVACAANGGAAPTDLSAFLPWAMPKDRLTSMRQPTSIPDAPSQDTS